MHENLFSKINLKASKLRPYEGFIFLCGGPTEITSHTPVSIRDALFRELVKNKKISDRLRVAEHYKDWGHDSVYSDLVLFEKHLAELSSVIVLVIESAGSIAELGLFSIIEEFQKKLLIFIETEHYNSPSFIKLGPINFLEKTLDNKAQCHRWLKQDISKKLIFDPALAESLQAELAEAVLNRANQLTSERTFRPDAWLDSALLLCDFLNLNSALTLREIKNLFEQFGHKKQELEIKQTLFTLERVGLIKMEPKGEQRFYINTESKLFLNFKILDSTFDLDRYRIDQLKIYKTNDIKRFRAIQAVRGKNVGT